MRKLTILGSTGSIGTQTLDLVRKYPEDLSVAALAAGRNGALLEQQAREFHPEAVCLYDEAGARDLRVRLADTDIRVVSGMEGLLELSSHRFDGEEILVNGLVGMIGIEPTLTAIAAGKTIALANKETLVAAGHLIMPAAEAMGVRILPVDSEHSAIFQCLNGEPARRLRRILLTCSGGTFRGRTREELIGMRAEDALQNPNWSMGNKVTIDSASLVNKGLEVMEASHLFGVDVDHIRVLVQSQSICHSAVEYTDGTIMAQLASPDMHLPIQYALFYPDRRELSIPELDLAGLGSLYFEEPDTETFRGLPLAYRAARTGGSMPTVFNAANEEAVQHFMAGRIEFLELYDAIEGAMDDHVPVELPDLRQVLEAEQEAREHVRAWVLKKHAG